MDRSSFSRALGVWIEKYRWIHFCTLTFKAPVSEETAERCLKKWLRKLERLNQQRVNWYFAIEGQLPHLHVLLANTERLTVTEIKAKWVYGFSRIERYSVGAGGSFYVTKSVGRTSDNWDFNLKNLEPSSKESNTWN